jgi:hypothetical protein
MQCKFCSNTNEAEIRNVPGHFFGRCDPKVVVPTCVNCYLEMFTEGCPESVTKVAYNEFMQSAFPL